jgi:hypothetical protein
MLEEGADESGSQVRDLALTQDRQDVVVEDTSVVEGRRRRQARPAGPPLRDKVVQRDRPGLLALSLEAQLAFQTDRLALRHSRARELRSLLGDGIGAALDHDTPSLSALLDHAFHRRPPGAVSSWREPADRIADSETRTAV